MTAHNQGEFLRLSSRVSMAVKDIHRESEICHRASSGVVGTDCSFLSRSTFVRFCIANQARRRSMEQLLLCNNCGIGHSILRKKEEGKMPKNVRFIEDEENSDAR